VHYDLVGAGTRAVVLANGLGGRLSAWQPLIDRLWDHKLRQDGRRGARLARSEEGAYPSVCDRRATQPGGMDRRPDCASYSAPGPYLRLFQELDAHSVYHLRREIETPTLIISGALDPLTPARQSWQMAARLPHARHLRLWRAGHLSLVERPEVVVPAIERFLEDDARW
jgi:pimeloyl-ACP methyl ester carboxylesterase